MNLINCEICNSEGWIWIEATASSEKCDACHGSGRRPFSREMLDAFTEAKDFIDDEIHEFFKLWCDLSGLHRAYGVESWKIEGGELRIVQDTSCRGCYSTESHRIPLEMLFADRDEMKRLIDEKQREREVEQAAKKRRLKTDEIRNLQDRLAKLQSEKDA